MTKTSNRLVYLDWMRGVGVLIMLQGHVFDAWVRPGDRTSGWFWLSQVLGGFPAPIFLFLVGVSLALVLDRLRAKGASARDLAIRVMRRGGWILFLAYVFRLEQFLVWYPHSQWRDVFRVDTLNCIAVCTLAIGLLSVAFSSRRRNIAAMGGATGAFVFATPLLYPLKGLPPFVLSYFNGNGNGAFFSFFPWAAFTLAGITFGYALLEGKERIGEAHFFKRVAVTGVAAYIAGTAMKLTTIFEYGFFDYSLTSPHFFLVRLGWILLILSAAYLWCRRESASRWSPLIILGQGSLLVYWLHMEIVYGRLFQVLGRSMNIREAALQLVWFIPLMLVLAKGLSRRGRAALISAALRRPQDQSQVACT
jgi:uncharacterized membrane protein